MDEKDKSNFQEWLIDEKGFEIKSARDVLSRLKRVSSLFNVNFNKSIDKIIFDVSSNDKFKELSPSVKSQLKRSVLLYKEFTK